MILEGIVTTVSAAGVVNVAPMGPEVPDDDPVGFAALVLKPFDTSRTHANLAATGVGVFHVTDDVELLAAATVGVAEPPTVAGAAVACPRLADCCRFYEFRTGPVPAGVQRPRLHATVVHAGRLRPFVGFHRARHAVLEAAILVSRLHLLGPAAVTAELDRLHPLVEKTGSACEHRAFDLLTGHVRRNGG